MVYFYCKINTFYDNTLLGEEKVDFFLRNSIFSDKNPLSIVFIMKNILSFLLAFLFVTNVFAEDSATLKNQTVESLLAIIAKYESRIKVLEEENRLLSQYIWSGSIIKAGTWVIVSSGSVVWQVLALWSAQKVFAELKTSNPNKANIIEKMNRALTNMRKTFSLPETTTITTFEFVDISGKDPAVFVDLDFEWGVTYTWAYDGKLLFSYKNDASTPKFLGWFKYDIVSKRYITKQGSNPFVWSPRSHIANPFAGILTPFTSETVVPVVSTWTTSSTGTKSPLVTTGGIQISFQDIQKAYTDKRYLTVISLSNTYLQSNPPTIDILRIRYRTFFIIGKYIDSLTEVEKIEKIQTKLERWIACDAEVIANYQKTQELVTKYGLICRE